MNVFKGSVIVLIFVTHAPNRFIPHFFCLGCETIRYFSPQEYFFVSLQDAIMSLKFGVNALWGWLAFSGPGRESSQCGIIR